MFYFMNLPYLHFILFSFLYCGLVCFDIRRLIRWRRKGFDSGILALTTTGHGGLRPQTVNSGITSCLRRSKRVFIAAIRLILLFDLKVI